MELKEIPIAEIRANPVALRSVNPETTEFKELVASIEVEGILTPISVRPKTVTDEDTGEKSSFYELIDGLQRFTAAQEAGLTLIPASIRIVEDDNKLLAQQLMANLHRIETKPAAYSQQLKRMMDNDPTLTKNEIARMVGKSGDWVDKRLALGNIESQNILDLVDDGKISLVNAYMLSRLPSAEQVSFMEDAMTTDAAEFGARVTNRLKEIRKERSGATGKAEFAPVPHLRKLKDLQEVSEDPNFANRFVKELGISDPVEAVRQTILYTIQLDNKSIEQQKARYNENQEAKESRRKKKAAENAEKKAEEAAKEAAAAKAAAEAEVAE